MKTPLVIGIDLGGTNIKAALVDYEGNVLRRIEQPTGASRGPGPVIDDLAGLVLRLRQSPPPPAPSHDQRRTEGLDSRSVFGIGLATPGPLDLRDGRIVRAANLPGWNDVPIRNALREKTGLPVALENDGNAAAYGEFCSGAGRGCQDLVMLTLGTGVGAGIIVNGRIVHGHFDNAAELGHLIAVVDGLPCLCGQRGCLEQYASASAIVRRVAELNRAGQGGLHQSRDREGAANPSRERSLPAAPLFAQDVAKAAASGDSICDRVWDEACLYLAIACVNIQHAFNPLKIVLGGGLSNAGGQLLDRVIAHFRNHAWSLYADAPEIVLAQLGSDAGVIGAAMLTRQLDPAQHAPIRAFGSCGAASSDHGLPLR